MDKWEWLAIAIAALLIVGVTVFALTDYALQGGVIERREFPQDGNVCYT